MKMEVLPYLLWQEQKIRYFRSKIHDMGSHTPTKFSPLQLELLKIFSFHPTEQELLQVKAMLARFFAERFADRVERAAAAKDITDEDLERWLNEENQ